MISLSCSNTNTFLVVVNAALLELASNAAGCPTGEELKQMEVEGVIESANDYECTGTVYGQSPVSLIANIAVISGLLAAFFMPIIGVILDFTSYRRFVGVSFSVIFTIIQAAQIGISQKTWFPMAILQSFAGFCFTIMILTALAYLPEICELVGQHVHASYTARFTVQQFIVQALFLVLVGVLSFGFGYNSVQTARLSQALNVGIICILFGMGWRIMPSRQNTRELPEGLGCCGILTYGFKQNLITAKSIWIEYKKGLRWYLLATMFVQAAVGALTTISVVYLSSEVGLNATDISLFFLAVLVGTIPGAKVASLLSKYHVNPNTSWQLSMISLFITLVIGAFTLGDARNKYLSLIWGFFVGGILGWFYPTENLFFSCVLPKNQEAEIAGFRVYCSMILSWFPPLVFSVLVENGFDAKWGMSFMGSFLLIGAILLKLGAGTWEEILHESGRSDLSEQQSSASSSPQIEEGETNNEENES